jgi:HK97 gp10 family phage protein
MGAFTTGGIAAELEKFDGLIKGTDEACMMAVKAGGDVLARRLKEAAPVYTGSRRDIKPGALRNSIKAGKPDYNAADGYHSKVEPVGKDHGEPLAKIGNILEYGRSNMSPQPWFNPTIEHAADEVVEAMQKTFGEAQGHG